MHSSIHHLDTPRVVIDLERLEANIVEMQARSDALGLALRPHVKSHKSRAIAKMQLAAGASSLSASKLDEAAVMIEGTETEEVLLAYSLATPTKARRAASLTSRLVVGIDSEEGLRALSAAALTDEIRVAFEIDCGLGRCGVMPADVADLARAARRLGGVDVVGVFTHAGHAYRCATPDDLHSAALDEVHAATLAADILRDEGVDVRVVSVGSTPTAAADVDRSGVTEWRPGNYVFLDRTQVMLGVCSPDSVALSVQVTVISTSGGRAVIDAGSKVFGLDRGAHGLSTLSGFGLDPQTGMVVDWLSEEHGVIEGGAASYRVGDRLRIMPNHACVVADLADDLVGARGDSIEQIMTVDAPGGGR